MIASALTAIGLAMLVALAALLLLRRRFAGPVAVASGYVTGHVMAAEVWPEFPPVFSEDWLPVLSVAVLVAAVLESQIRRGLWWRWVVRASVCGVTTFLVLRPFVDRWSIFESTAWIAGEALAWLLLWGGFDRLAGRCDRQSGEWRAAGVLFLLSLVVVTSASSVALLNSASAKLAQLAGALAAVVGVCTVFAWCKPSSSLCRGIVAVSTFLLVGLWMSGYHVAELPPRSAALFGLTGLLAWIGSLGAVEKGGRWPAAIIRFVLVATPALLGLWLTMAGSAGGDSSY